MEELEEWINKLKNSKKPVIVEGIKDRLALESFGVKNIITLNKPLYEIIEDVACKHKKCIVLTDLDRKGKELYGKLSSGLQRLGVEVDNYFREFLLKKTKLRQIEGLGSYFSNLH